MKFEHIQWTWSFIVSFKRDNEVSQTSMNMQHHYVNVNFVYAPTCKQDGAYNNCLFSLFNKFNLKEIEILLFMINTMYLDAYM